MEKFPVSWPSLYPLPLLPAVAGTKFRTELSQGWAGYNYESRTSNSVPLDTNGLCVCFFFVVVDVAAALLVRHLGKEESCVSRNYHQSEMLADAATDTAAPAIQFAKMVQIVSNCAHTKDNGVAISFWRKV